MVWSNRTDCSNRDDRSNVLGSMYYVNEPHQGAISGTLPEHSTALPPPPPLPPPSLSPSLLAKPATDCGNRIQHQGRLSRLVVSLFGRHHLASFRSHDSRSTHRSLHYTGFDPGALDLTVIPDSRVRIAQLSYSVRLPPC